MADIPSLIESSVGGNKEDTRSLFQAFNDQLTLLNAATGNNMLAPTNSTQKPQSPPPAAGGIGVSGANGAYQVGISNPSQSVSATIYHEVSYSPVKSFGQNVTTLPVSAATSVTVPNPGATLYFRLRSSYDQQNWNSYTLAATTAVAAGLQSSAASENNTPLNQSNYAYVDSIDAGAYANVRVYGAAGPNNSYTAVKGGAETVLPSATIINVAHGSNQIVSYDGEQYQVKPTLPGVFPDSWTPTGKVSVVGTGTPTLPTVTLVVQGGYVVGATFTPGSGLTQLPTFTITDTSGSGASIVATGLSGGGITGIQVTNSGNGHYSSSPTVTAAGGVFSGASGGGTSSGGNGGRLTAI